MHVVALNLVHHKPLRLIVPPGCARGQGCRVPKVQGRKMRRGLVWGGAVGSGAESDGASMVCNVALKAMLKDDIQGIESVQDDLMAMGTFFSSRDNKDGALFILSLYKLTEHEISLAVDSLQGKYKDAYVKVFGLLEDSGWKLKKEGEDDDEDEDALPVMGSGMYG